uniref:J domain-containing protein n=1 Tax=Heterosigma akashiwo TaxID=2829 RepID=A0A7S3Y1H3_HETAK
MSCASYAPKISTYARLKIDYGKSRSLISLFQTQRSIPNHDSVQINRKYILHRNFSAEASKNCEAESSCWQCGLRDRCSGFFCDCGALQPLQNENYFEILKCPVHFDVDMKYLEQNYWKLQKQLHPDLYGTRHQIEQELSAQNSSQVNHAYQTLKDPVERVKYLLSLYGIEVLHEQSGTQEVDPMFLMQVMEMREEIEEAKTPHKIEQLMQTNHHAIDQTLRSIKTLFDGKELTKIAEEAVKLQYYTRINAEACQKLDELEPDH